MLKYIFALALACLLLSSGLAQSTSDNVPPSITLASAISEAVAPTTLFLAALANDTVGVVRVEFFTGDEKLSETSSSPFTAAVSISNDDIGIVSFTAIAYDAAGNSTESIVVTVSVSGDASSPAQTSPPQTPSTTPATLSATDDSYTTIVNTILEVGSGNAPGLAAVRVNGTVLDNDLGMGSSAEVRAESVATALGGAVTLSEDGSFSYSPPLNTSNQTDSFSYTLIEGAQTTEGNVSIE